MILAGIGLLAWMPDWLKPPARPEATERWRLFMSVIGLIIGWRCVKALIDPAPRRVQFAVKECILSVIVLDAAVCFSMAGLRPAAAVLFLLVLALFLGRRVYST